MKKFYYILSLFLIICGNAFSQIGSNGSEDVVSHAGSRETVKQAVIVDLFPLMEGVWEGKIGAGLFYEVQVHRLFSLVTEVNFYTDFDDELMLSALEHWRIYPLGIALNKLFFDIGAGYRKSTLERDNVRCLELSGSAGWRFVMGKGFLIEPSVGYRQNVYTFLGHESKKGGITINVGLGFMF